MSELKKIEAFEKEFLKTSKSANKVYDSVISLLDIDHSDKDLVEETLDVLRRQTRDFMVETVWKNLTEAQAEDLQTYLEDTFNRHSWVSVEEAVLAFAEDSPPLMEKIYAGLDDFFDKFVKRFNSYIRA